MRVTIISKAFVVGSYQRKLEEIAAQEDISLTALVPSSWREGHRTQMLERAHTLGYDLIEVPIAFNGHFHTHFYPTLPHLLRRLQPDLLHVDEEPYNLATYLAIRTARRQGIRTLFFSWQNILRHYPPPFSLMEHYAFDHAQAAIAGSIAASQVLRAKGYQGPLAVIPQFGVDPQAFHPEPRLPNDPARPLVIGYAGRLVEEKGLLVLLQALERLDYPWKLAIAGSGSLRDEISAWFALRSIPERLTLFDHLPSDQMPGFMNTLDVLVLPSLTKPNWKEQFGRVLVEAMACAVPVVGSDSGEIPHVIGDAGLVIPEGDAQALASALGSLYDPVLRRELGLRGRGRVLANYTHSRIAQQTVAFYREIIGLR